MSQASFDRLRTSLLTGLLALAAGAPAQAAPAATAAPTPAEAEVIVRFRHDASLLREHALPPGVRGEAVLHALAGRAQALGARAGRVLAPGAAVAERTQVVRAAGIDAAELARRLAADPAVEFAVPNGRKKRLAAPNDPLYAASATELRSNGIDNQRGPRSGQWYLRKPDATLRSAIDIEAAWARLGSRGSDAVVVALLDTGVRYDHPDLRRLADGGRLLAGHDFVADVRLANDNDGRDGDATDPGDWVSATEAGRAPFDLCPTAQSSSWHGTATASLIGAGTDNALGMAGAAPGTRVLPVRVLGKCYGNDSDIVAGLRWAAGLHVDGVPDNPTPAKVINLSLGSQETCSALYQSAVDEIVARGVMVVAAAGNSAGEPTGSPANCRGVVAVAGLRHAGTKVGFSDLGPEIAIAAPAGNCINITAGSPCLYPILAATNSGAQGPVAGSWTDSFDISVGTSFSSPLVAAAAALVWSQQPALGVEQVRALLRSTARPFPTSGADNGPDDPTPVTQCRAPQAGVEQLQCYCTTALCGAGMLDAGAAVAAAAGPYALIRVTPAAPVAGSAITFDAADSIAPSGATITRYAWALVDGGGIASGFTSATNASTATLTPSGAGTLQVALTVFDSAGGSARTELAVNVAAAPPPPPPPSSGSGGGGGGAFGLAWLAGLGLAVAALRGARPRR